jgi:glyoxylase-like metal-dependent hydrolase (beta-lactamase superfamily II)
MTRLYAFHCGGDVVDKAIADPLDVGVGTKVDVPWFFYVLVHSGGNVMFESGVHPDLVDDPGTRLGFWADVLEIRVRAGDDVVSQLASIELAPEDITTVVLSHMHFDHVSALPLFGHARIVVQRSELSFARSPAAYQADLYNAPDFAGDHDWLLLEGPHDLFDDRHLEIIPTPGHTPGHQSLLVRTEHSRVMLLGDATYSLAKMRQRRLPAVVWSPDAMVASWELIEWLEAREQAILLYAHDEDYESRVRLAPREFYK